MFRERTAYNEGNYMRSWRLLAAAWLAAHFSAGEGLPYLHKLNDNQKTLSPADNALLTEAAIEANGLAAMMSMVANCANAAVKTMLAEVGHPNLGQVASDTLQSEPDYDHLSGSSEDASARLAFFTRCRAELEAAAILPKSGPLLDLACGPLAEQALLFGSAGYNVTAVDVEIPPGYLPLSGLTPWFKRRKHSKSWQAATEPFYQALAQQSRLKLNWNKVKIKLADITRLDELNNDFVVVLCANFLHHAPDVAQLLAEAARVMKTGGLFVANIRPYAGFTGAFQLDANKPWAHLQPELDLVPQLPLNRWREAQYKQAVEKQFKIEQWLPELDEKVKALLTPDLKKRLTAYAESELICRQIWLVARKA
jgi:SAM-dependent methyltransferase